MGGAEKANDLLSSKSCLRDVVVGVSSSKIYSQGRYLQANWRVNIVIISFSYELSSSYNVFIKIIKFKQGKKREEVDKSERLIQSMILKE